MCVLDKQGRRQVWLQTENDNDVEEKHQMHSFSIRLTHWPQVVPHAVKVIQVKQSINSKDLNFFNGISVPRYRTVLTRTKVLGTVVSASDPLHYIG